MGGRRGAAPGDVTRSSSSSRPGSPRYVFDEPGGGPGVANAHTVSLFDTHTVPARYWHHDDDPASPTRWRLPLGTGAASPRRRIGRHRRRLLPAETQNPTLIADYVG